MALKRSGSPKARTALKLILALSAAIELLLGLGILFVPTYLMSAFGISQLTPELHYLAGIIAMFCLLVAAICGMTIQWIEPKPEVARTLSNALGLWWIALGVYLSVKFGRTDHLALDALKGALIVGLARFSLR